MRKNNCVHVFSALIHHCAVLVIPDSTVLTPKDGLRWHKPLVKLALKLLENIMYVKHAVLFDLFFCIIIPAGVRAVDLFLWQVII